MGLGKGVMAMTATTSTYDDVNLILKLYDLRREERLREARAWFIGNFKAVKTFEDFQRLCPAGSDANASYRMMTTYWEMVASFITSGVLHRELFYQSGRELLLVWARVREVLPQIRDAYKNQTELRNLEVAAHAYIAWWNAASPGAYDAFSKRIGG
jgi:hypothetical protein